MASRSHRRKTSSASRSPNPPAAATPPAPPRQAPIPEPMHRAVGRPWVGLVAPMLVALAAYAAFLPALAYEFVQDDIHIVQYNTRLDDLDRPAAYLATSWWNRPGENKEYRPLTMATFALNRAWGGNDPTGYHWVNNLLHMLNALLVWLLARRLARGHPRAEIIALLSGLAFAVHAVHVEAVAGIVGRAELLMAAAYLVAIRCSIERMTAIFPGRRVGWTAGAALAALAAVFSKEHAVTLPIAIALLALVPLAGTDAQDRIQRLMPAIVAAAAAVVTYLIVRRLVIGAWIRPQDAPIDAILNPLVALDPLSQKLGALALLLRAAGHLLWPASLASLYSYPETDPNVLLQPVRWFGGLALLASTLAAAWGVRRQPVLRFALALLLVTLAVGSNLLVLIGTVFADRMLYLPSAAFCLAVAAGALGLPRIDWKIPALAVVLWIGGLAVLHVRYLPHWRNDDALTTYSFHRTPGIANTQLSYAITLWRQQKYPEALELVEQALAQDPADFKGRAWKAAILAYMGREAEALLLLQELHREQPGRAFVNAPLSFILTKHLRFEEAYQVLLEGVAAEPENEEGRRMLFQWEREHLVRDEATTATQVAP